MLTTYRDYFCSIFPAFCKSHLQFFHFYTLLHENLLVFHRLPPYLCRLLNVKTLNLLRGYMQKKGAAGCPAAPLHQFVFADFLFESGR